MKLKHSIIFMALLAITSMFASCSEGEYWDEYIEEAEKYSFVQAASKYSIEASETLTEVKVEILRSNTNGTVTLPITAKFNSEILSGAESVTFEEGSNKAVYTFSVGNMEIGFQYKAVLSIAEENVSVSGNATSTITMVKNYNWISLGTGSYVDNFISGVAYPVEIMQAEGFEVYRAMDPYTATMKNDDGEWGDWRNGKQCEYVEFWTNSDNTIGFDPIAVGVNYEAVAGQDIIAYPATAFKGLDPSKSRWYNEKTAFLAPYYYIDGVGGWNYTTADGVIIITLP